MSKSNMLLGLAKGKVGDLVFYRDGGEQRTRTRVVPKNPRTPAQMSQRVKMANVSAIYRALSNVLSESFTNRPSNQSGYNAFAAQAIGLAPYQTKAMAAVDAVIPQPAFASKGVLPAVPTEGDFAGEIFYGIPVTLNGAATAPTIAQLSQALVEEYSQFNYGDKITFVAVRFSESNVEVEGVKLRTPFIVTNVLELSSSNTATLSSLGFSLNDHVLSTDMFVTLAEGEVGMAAIIHSHVNENGQLEASSQMFQLTPAAQTLYESYRTQQALDAAVQSYMVGSESILR